MRALAQIILFSITIAQSFGTSTFPTGKFHAVGFKLENEILYVTSEDLSLFKSSVTISQKYENIYTFLTVAEIQKHTGDQIKEDKRNDSYSVSWTSENKGTLKNTNPVYSKDETTFEITPNRLIIKSWIVRNKCWETQIYALNDRFAEFPPSEHIQKWGMSAKEVIESIEIPDEMKQFTKVYEENGRVYQIGPFNNIYYFDDSDKLAGIRTIYYSENKERYQNLKTLIYDRMISELSILAVQKHTDGKKVYFGDTDEFMIFEDEGEQFRDGTRSWTFSTFLMLRSFYPSLIKPKE